MDFNTLLFGGLSILSLAVFFYLSRFKASSRQTQREDRIDWSSRQFSLWKVFLCCRIAAIGVAVLAA